MAGKEVTQFKLDVNVEDSQGHTLLHQVVAKNYIQLMPYLSKSLYEKDMANLKLLLKFKADINASDLTPDGENILHLAIKNGRPLEMVQIITAVLLDNGVDINLADKEGHTALYHALSPISIRYDHDSKIGEYSSFNFKFKFTDVAIVQHLVYKVAKIDIIDNNGYSLLLMAVIMRRYDYVKILLENKEKLSEGVLEKTADTFLYNWEERYGVSAKYPPKEYHNLTPLLTAVNGNDIEMVKMLIKAGANVNAVNGNKDNALHMITKGDVSCDVTTPIAKLLIDNGINLNAKNGEETTALQLAMRNGKQDLVTYILEKGLAASSGLAKTIFDPEDVWD